MPVLAVVVVLALSHCAIPSTYRVLEVTEVVATGDGETVVTLRRLVSRESIVQDESLRVLTIRADDVECAIVQNQPSDAWFHMTRYLHDASPPALVLDEGMGTTSVYEDRGDGWRRTLNIPDGGPSAAWTGVDGQIRILSELGLHTIPEDRSAPLPPPVPFSGACTQSHGGSLDNVCSFVPVGDDAAVGFRLDWADASMVRATCDAVSCVVEEGGPAGSTASIGSLINPSSGQPLYVVQVDESFAAYFSVLAFDGPQERIAFPSWTYSAALRPGGGFALFAFGRSAALVFVRDADGMTQRFELDESRRSSSSVGVVVTGTGADERVRVYLDRGPSAIREITLAPSSGVVETRNIHVCN